MLYLAACVYRPFRVMLSPSKMQRKITAMLEIVETAFIASRVRNIGWLE